MRSAGLHAMMARVATASRTMLMIKRISILARRPDIDRETFLRHWREVHAPLARKVPGLIRYVQNAVVEQGRHPSVPAEDRPVDGFAELWFADRAGMAAALASPEAAAMLADGAKIMGAVSTFIVEERLVIGD